MSEMAMKYEDWLRGCVHHDGRKGNVYLPCDMVLAIADWIEAHRDVAPVRHGRWMPLTDCSNEGIYCSECHKKVYRAEYSNTMKMHSPYCPNCGAKMDEETK